MSSGSPRRFTGSCPARRSPNASTSAAAKSVFTRPGAMPTTRVGPSSCASCRVRWMSAALVRLYGPSAPPARRPPTEAMLSITPGWSFIARSHAAWHQNTGPRRLTWKVLSKRPSSTAIVGPMYGLVAALLTRMSNAPKRSRVACTHARAAAVSPALAANTAVSPLISAAAASSWSCLRDDSITFAPAAANEAAMAFPMPFEAPVTSATFPSSEISMRRTLVNVGVRLVVRGNVRCRQHDRHDPVRAPDDRVRHEEAGAIGLADLRHECGADRFPPGHACHAPMVNPRCGASLAVR